MTVPTRAQATTEVGDGPPSPSVPFTMLGSPDAVVCEGDACLVVPAHAVAPSDEDPADEPGRRGVSR